MTNNFKLLDDDKTQIQQSDIIKTDIENNLIWLKINPDYFHQDAKGARLNTHGEAFGPNGKIYRLRIKQFIEVNYSVPKNRFIGDRNIIMKCEMEDYPAYKLPISLHTLNEKSSTCARFLLGDKKAETLEHNKIYTAKELGMAFYLKTTKSEKLPTKFRCVMG